jgi:hypothetical protein
MSGRVGNIVILAEEPERRCELCGKWDECRPAGPKGEQVCYDCGMKDPAAMKRYADKLFNGGLTQ